MFLSHSPYLVLPACAFLASRRAFHFSHCSLFVSCSVFLSSLVPIATASGNWDGTHCVEGCIFSSPELPEEPAAVLEDKPGTLSVPAEGSPGLPEQSAGSAEAPMVVAFFGELPVPLMPVSSPPLKTRLIRASKRLAAASTCSAATGRALPSPADPKPLSPTRAAAMGRCCSRCASAFIRISSLSSLSRMFSARKASSSFSKFTDASWCLELRIAASSKQVVSCEDAMDSTEGIFSRPVLSAVSVDTWREAERWRQPCPTLEFENVRTNMPPPPPPRPPCTGGGPTKWGFEPMMKGTLAIGNDCNAGLEGMLPPLIVPFEGWPLASSSTMLSSTEGNIRMVSHQLESMRSKEFGGARSSSLW
mmetsp:Transcript_112111/g.312045  ORF Transcript_112111/g.312045 Transcript_112111/m.312045 type:complete len:362 (-) Transcript_112111:2070-3155(-)